MGLPDGIGLFSTPKSSPNKYRRGMVDALLRVGTNTLELSTPPVCLEE